LATADQPAPSARARIWPLTRRWTALVLLFVAVFVGLRLVQAVQARPEPTTVTTASVVVIGVTGRFQLTATDRAVLDAHRLNVQVAAVSVRPRYIGDCAAAGWATLGAGRRTAVSGLCDPQVQQQRVSDWPQRLAAAAANHGDARLGTLAGSVPVCVAAVGPGAALAAARPDGTLAHYETVQRFLTEGLTTPCPITVVDAGADADPIIDTLLDRPDTTIIVTGIGPAAQSSNPGLQALYFVPVTPAGWLTSASTRRDGVVNLTDLTRSLIDFGRSGSGTALTVPVDGASFQVRPGPVTGAAAEQHLEAVAALSQAVLRSDLVLGVGGALLLGVATVSAMARRFATARVVAAFATVVPASMMLTGAVPWSQASLPATMLSLAVAGWGVVLTVVVLAVARRIKAPVAVVGAAVTVFAFSVDAALGAVMQPGSMLNSRPVNGGRWYGFGNVTFAVYATATFVLVGYLVYRLRLAGQRRAGLVAAVVVGFFVVLCEGWPSMGADFGGVIALTPAVLWLVLALSDSAVTWRKLALAGALAVLVVAAISWLDWRRGPARSHLGGFVQRVLDGDAQDIVIRKAAAADQSLLTPAGIGTLIVGVAVWILLFRRLLPSASGDFGTIRPVAIAALGVAILGTLVNDGGVTVWYTSTAAFTITIAALLIDRAHTTERGSDRRGCMRSREN